MRKRPIRKLARTGTDDRLRLIAYEIHDGLCQQLAAGISYLSTFAETNPKAHGKDDQFFDLGMQALNAAMHESRELVGRLRQLSGSQPHLVEAINQLIHESHWSDTIEVSFHHDVPRGMLSYAEFNTTFRIIQESLNNVARHSGSETARVEAIVAGSVLRVRIEDDGIGFDPSSVNGDHFGIEGMRLRAALLEGQFDIDSRVGAGTRIRAEIPIGRSAKAS
jgi:signal transduction histidine kinase